MNGLVVATVISFSASAQEYSAHSVRVASDNGPDTAFQRYEDFREISIVSEDFSTFTLSLPGCDFELTDRQFEVEENRANLTSMADRYFEWLGWPGKTTFLGDLSNAKRTSVSAISLSGFRCETDGMANLVAISTDPYQDQKLLKRFSVIILQGDPLSDHKVRIFVEAREDVITLKRLEDLEDTVGAVSGLVGALLEGLPFGLE